MATSIAFLEDMLLQSNIQAALKTLRHCEGTGAADGYNYLFTSSPKNTLRFTGYDKHPALVITSGKIKSSAAGAYQILKTTDDLLNKKYGFTDFAPHTQDLKALAIFDMIGVLVDVSKGYMLRNDVMKKLSNQWASLPFNPYPEQGERTMKDVRNFYLGCGGIDKSN